MLLRNSAPERWWKEASDDEALEKLRKCDRERESYYNYFTNRHWGKADNYDLTFNSARLPLDSILPIILKAVRRD